MGKTDAALCNRLSYHEGWLEYESDPVKVSVAYVGGFNNQKELEKETHYPKADA